MATSVFSVTGSPSFNSLWVKLFILLALCQAGSLKSPSSLMVSSIKAASMLLGGVVCDTKGFSRKMPSTNKSSRITNLDNQGSREALPCSPIAPHLVRISQMKC